MKYKNVIILMGLASAICIGSLDVNAESVLAGKKANKKEKCYSSTDSKKEISCDEARKQSDLYPNATRIMPDRPQSKIQGDMVALSKTNLTTDPNAVVSAAQRVYNNTKASTYEKAVAAYMLSSAYRQIDSNNILAIDYAIIAIQLNALDNNLHYQLMDVLSYMLLRESKYEESLQYSTRLINESGTQNISTLQMQGNALYRLGRYAEAIPPLLKAYEADGGANQNLAGMLFESYSKTNQTAEAAKIKNEMDKRINEAATANPKDKNVQSKQLSIYASSEQYEKAAKLFDEMNAKGQITTNSEYEAGYISYYNWPEHEKQVIAIINEGLTKKVIPENDKVYQILGHSYYMANNTAGAIEAWSKGALLSKDGEQNLLLAQLLSEENEYTKSKEQAQQALSKGVKNKGEAYLILALIESEFGLNNRTAMIEALNQAAKYPESKEEAKKLLKQAGVK